VTFGDLVQRITFPFLSHAFVLKAICSDTLPNKLTRINTSATNAGCGGAALDFTRGFLFLRTQPIHETHAPDIARNGARIN
jgi:hypothetical protein